MKLITKVEIPEIDQKITYSNRLVFLGSCFSGNIGNKFKEGAFNTLVNPFGVIFNPLSIFILLDRVIEKNNYTENDWLYENGRYVNLELHGDLSFSSVEEANNTTNKLLNDVYDFLIKSDYLFLTFGTAWVYDYIENNKLAANCHKIPQKRFSKRLLTVDEIYQKAISTLSKVQELNTSIKTVFTVSPVRHLADGAHQNNLSKAVLHLFINQYQNNFNSYYFPSYEIVVDELRDYRFFAEDMIHPNNLATQYVWEILLENWVEQNSIKLYEKVLKLKRASQHRPFNIESDAHQKFVHSSIAKLKALENENTYLNLGEIQELFEKQLLK